MPLPQPIGPVSLSAHLSAAIRDYPAYMLSFAQVTNGRQDNRFGLSIDMTFQTRLLAMPPHQPEWNPDQLQRQLV